MLAPNAEAVTRVGPRLLIRRFRRDDVDRMQTWRPYDDLLFLPYNMPRGSHSQNDAWFERNVQRSGRRYFSIVRREDGRLIGVISLRGIKKATRPTWARLGITLGAEFVEQGCGTEALALFLDYFFADLGFDLMKLDVGAFNGRAIHVYEKCGFETVEKFYRSTVGVQHPPQGVGSEAHFVKHQGEHLTLHHEMQLSRAVWEACRESVFDALEARVAMPAD